MSLVETGRWYPIAAEHDLPPNHIYRTLLGGHELAVWRASDSSVCIWQDRCPHRGVRFSLGEVAGDELRCQYHAWRFGKSGACTFIPAQPDSKVPAAIRASVWPVALYAGMVWTGINPAGQPPALPTGAVVRAMPVCRAPEVVAQAIAGAGFAALTLLVQPTGPDAAVLRGIATDGDVAQADRLLLALRRTLEAGA